MSERQIILETLYGPLHVVDWPDDLLVRSLKMLGEWSAVEAMLAAELIDAGQSLWDGGAFLGTFSLGVARRCELGKVVAIEANPELFDALTQNLSLLSCSADLVPEGLGECQGWLSPVDKDPLNHGATAFHFSRDELQSGEAIHCRSLKELRRDHGNYDMIKLDLEGMELDALKGDLDYIKTRQPVIWAECNEGQASLQLFSGMKWAGYEVAYLAFPAFRKDNFRGSGDLIYPMAYEAALVAAAPDRLDALGAKAPALVPGEDILFRRVEEVFDLRRALYDTPRWSRTDWAGMSRAELIARLTRVEKGVDLTDFLS